jgi:tetratricopeptide (TPR) repeat protein
MLRPVIPGLVLCAVATCHGQDTLNDPRFAQAMLLDSLEKHDRSIKLLLELAQEPTYRAKALRAAADCEFHHLRKVDDAFAHMADAIAADPESAHGYINRSLMYEYMGMSDRAIEDLTVAIPLTKTSQERCTAHMNLGAVYQGIRAFDRALAEYDTALAEDTSAAEVLLNRSSVLDDLGRPDEALAILLRLNADEPDNLVYMNNTGFLLIGMERYAEAVDWFTRGLRVRPDDSYSLNNRGYARLKAGDTDGALKDVERSLVVNPDNAYAYRNLGLVQTARGDTKKACEAFEQALARGYTERYGDDVKKLHESTCH